MLLYYCSFLMDAWAVMDLHSSRSSVVHSRVGKLQPVCSLMLSGQDFVYLPLLCLLSTVPCRMASDREECCVVWLHQVSLQRSTIVNSGSYSLAQVLAKLLSKSCCLVFSVWHVQHPPVALVQCLWLSNSHIRKQGCKLLYLVKLCKVWLSQGS